MALVLFKDFLFPYIIPEVGGVPEALLLQTIRQTIREFCENTQIYKEELEPINLVKDQFEYTLASTIAEAEIDSIIHVVLKTNDDPTNLGTLYRAGYDYSSPTEKVLRTNIVHSTIPNQDVPDGLRITVALRPLLDAFRIDDVFLKDWYETLANGVQSRLMLMGKKPWTDRQQGMIKRALFRNGMSSARVELARAAVNTRSGTHQDTVNRLY